jgi:hypothetical protein
MTKHNLLPQFYIAPLGGLGGVEHLKNQLKRTEFLIFSILLGLLQSHRWVRLGSQSIYLSRRSESYQNKT